MAYSLIHVPERPSIQKTKNFSVKALQMKPLVKEHLVYVTVTTFGGYIFIICRCFQAFVSDPLTHGLLSTDLCSSLTRQKWTLNDKRNNIYRNSEIACTKLSCKTYIYRDLYSKNTPCSRKRQPPVSDHEIFAFWVVAYVRFDVFDSIWKTWNLFHT